MRWPRTVTDEAQWLAGLRARPDPRASAGPGHPRRPRRRACPASSPAPTAASAATAIRRRSRPRRSVRPGRHRRSASSCIPCSTRTRSSFRRTSSRGRRVSRPHPSCARCWADGGARGFEYVFSWRDGRLRLAGCSRRRTQAAVGLRRASRRRADESAHLIGRRGRRVAAPCARSRHGRRWSSMRWATYRFTRTQESFDGQSPSDP